MPKAALLLFESRLATIKVVAPRRDFPGLVDFEDRHRREVDFPARGFEMDNAFYTDNRAVGHQMKDLELDLHLGSEEHVEGSADFVLAVEATY